MFKDDLPGVKRFPHLFQPTRIGKHVAHNAVKYAACSVSNFNTRDGFVSERELGRMGAVAQTGAGIITNQGAYPDADGMGKAYFRQLSIADDRYIPGLAKVADLIHAQGALAIQQILHGGRYGGIDADHCLQASDVPQTLKHFRSPRAMSRDQIAACIRDHAAASRRALQAGYDGVEVTAFMGYLLANFLSPFTNTRTDEYGGSLTNRMRFMLELIDAIKQEIGDAIFWIRLNGEELMDDRGGGTPDECLEAMKTAAEAGVDGISIVVGWHESTSGALGRDLPSDRWLHLAERAKAVIDVPVAFGPRFGDPVRANQAIGEGKLDFWEVCRPFLADPELLHKVAEDRLDEVRPCLGGLKCLSRMFRNLPYICTMNPRLGHEYEAAYAVTPAEAAKRVVVIGGGPAGTEAALAAARRGHEVTLYERSDRLGGQVRSAALEIEAGGQAFADLTASFARQLEVAGVRVELGVEVTPKLIGALAPDVAIVATGATVAPSDLPGAELPHVRHGYWTVDEPLPVGQRVVIIGGERAGLVMAERLATSGRQVTVVDEDRIARDVIPTFRWRHTTWVKELDIAVVAPARVTRIEDDAVHVVSSRDGSSHVLPADLVLIAGPRVSRNALVSQLEFSVDELYVVGDAVLPRSVAEAIHEGFRTGNRV